MSEFTKVCQVSDIPDPGKELFEVEDTLVVVAHVDGQFYCIDDVCTHDGGPLSEGPLDNHAIICPRHGARFDIRDGRALTMPATEATSAHQVKVEGDDVYVRLGAAPEPAPAAPAAADETSEEPHVAGSPASSSAASALAASAESPSSTEEKPAVANAATTATVAGPLTEDHVREELKQVIDPELFVNIVDLGLIYVVDIAPREEDDKLDINIDMTLTSPACPAGPQLIGNTKQVLGRLDSVNEVTVKIVLDPPWSPDRMTDDARDQLGIF